MLRKDREVVKCEECNEEFERYINGKDVVLCSKCEDKRFWRHYHYVTVNGVDTIATLATYEDSPSWLL